ncbi:uncharacterized protein LOC115996025 [Ipomoea triloba]|uniref:uncharacterized protein LOC115996025 n=1 Tax=Ipomoea triloba TaxID=35885 RepID=UPI00125D9361|nr:uncharacterized protein LOC115996025 [Ipomoea triloba]
MGFGWVVRDAEGVVVGVAMRCMEGLFSVKEAEAMGAREALSWLKRRGWRHVIMESDAQVVTLAVQQPRNATPFGGLISEICELLQQLESVTFVYVHRSLNMPAHVLAKESFNFPNAHVPLQANKD